MRVVTHRHINPFRSNKAYSCAIFEEIKGCAIRIPKIYCKLKFVKRFELPSKNPFYFMKQTFPLAKKKTSNPHKVCWTFLETK
jgi:hypothetical protein